ncbi:peptidase M76 family-domain-containing protein [Xylariaceae sp. FL0255]|nr:peptidase M76 family-domain-containing protein [Xylariaceae sp. FL0255]
MASSVPTPDAPQPNALQPRTRTPAAATTPSSSSPTPSDPSNLRFLENDPKRTGFDPKTQWWINYFKILTGKITPEGAFHYRESRYIANEERDCKQCEHWRDFALAHSPTVVFLRRKIEALNGRMDSSNIICGRCPGRLFEDGSVIRQSGGFDPRFGILLCANELRSRSHLEDTLSHEMVHAWDMLRWKVDWEGKTNLRHSACTEIRAAMLSGECRWTKETMTRGNWTLTQQFQDCVRRRAVKSVMARPACKDDVQAVKVVNSVWDSCFSDTRPFDEVYR